MIGRSGKPANSIEYSIKTECTLKKAERILFFALTNAPETFNIKPLAFIKEELL